jgi:hypothetical protein
MIAIILTVIMLNKLQKTVYKATKKGTPFEMPIFNLRFLLYFL